MHTLQQLIISIKSDRTLYGKPIDSFYSAIMAMDKGNNGNCNHQDFQAGLVRLGLGLSSHQVEDLITLLDPDQTGYIDVEDFASLLQAVDDSNISLIAATSPKKKHKSRSETFSPTLKDRSLTINDLKDKEDLSFQASSPVSVFTSSKRKAFSPTSNSILIDSDVRNLNNLESDESFVMKNKFEYKDHPSEVLNKMSSLSNRSVRSAREMFAGVGNLLQKIDIPNKGRTIYYVISS